MTDSSEGDQKAKPALQRFTDQARQRQQIRKANERSAEKNDEKIDRARLAFQEIVNHLEKMVTRFNALDTSSGCSLEKHGPDVVLFHFDGNCCTLKFAFLGPKASRIQPGFHLIPSPQSHASIQYYFAEKSARSGWYQKGTESPQSNPIDSFAVANLVLVAVAAPADCA